MNLRSMEIRRRAARTVFLGLAIVFAFSSAASDPPKDQPARLVGGVGVIPLYPFQESLLLQMRYNISDYFSLGGGFIRGRYLFREQEVVLVPQLLSVAYDRTQFSYPDSRAFATAQFSARIGIPVHMSLYYSLFAGASATVHSLIAPRGALSEPYYVEGTVRERSRRAWGVTMGSSLAVSSRMRIGFQTGPMFNRYRTGSIRAVTIEAPLTHRSVPDDLLELEAQRRALAARYTDSPAPYIWTWIAYVEFAIGK